MKKHEILSPQARAALFDPPNDPAAIIRHYTLSPDDLALIRRRRRDANRLGFAVHLAYQRFPGRVLGIDETPPRGTALSPAHQCPANGSEQNVSLERLLEKIECSLEHGGDRELSIPLSGDHDDRHRDAPLIHRRQEIESVYFRHMYVRHHATGIALSDRVEEYLSRLMRVNRVTFRRQ